MTDTALQNTVRTAAESASPSAALSAVSSAASSFTAEDHVLAATLFDRVRDLSFDGVGVSRESYGASETATLDYLTEWAIQQGLEVVTDAAANRLFTLPGSGDAAHVVVGSHVDSVPQGGNFDGLAGVISGLLCLKRLKDEGRQPAHPLMVAGMRGEESAWFGKAYMGSSAILGKLTADDLALVNKRNGKSMGEAMAAAGVDIDVVAAGTPMPWVSKVHAYLELHIEQGPIMVARKWPTAIVSGIRGNLRHNSVACIGEPGHSGAVPRWLRKDAVFAVADLLMRLDEHWRVLLERGNDLVVTSGIMGTDPAEHAVSRIPGQVNFSFEVRSESTDTLEAFYKVMRDECDAVARQRGVRFEFDRRIASAPAVMDTGIVKTLLDTADALSLPVEKVASGAGHDAALFANAGIPSGMIFIRNEHGSHNPQEAMDMDDFMAGTNLLYHALLRM
ncbi:hydantoinase/carbamoylase family amidase [Pigmentiphaga litoralis]|uniref:N-carbamoyl-L-amino-acid hydrolase n=1 Tax=Pigmentiphaga litoralis TaxID=516702 RepID=A0A7Y9IPR8_9BURK|nr:hydantoinase/carbamoylase family amidase [Pigmentiphaga litoralis]NYE25563.1 N-carbamoyl-L-amino-acid hydrolase [Pigmentiphaga litoralis]NYE80825.1 N-carbamoyl-L-amino-acid hydrolase [Pigmentiphaga litoralis]